MEEKSVIEVGIEKGYLQKRKVYIKPVSINQPMLINKNDPQVKFMMEGCKWGYMLGIDSRGELLNPFSSEEERKYFEGIWGRSLNHRDYENNYWTSPHSIVYIDKTQELLAGRVYFDLANPEHNLRWRVLKSCSTDFADGQEDFDRNPYRKFILVDEGFEINEKSEELKNKTDVYVAIGKIIPSKEKMIEFLTLYYAFKKTGKIVPEDNKSDWYESQIMGCLDKDFDICKKIIEDKDRDIKALIATGLSKGAVERVGVASYRLPGMNESYPMEQFITELTNMKETTDPLYITLVAQTEKKSKSKKE